MNRYIRADLHRIFRRIPRYIFVGVLFVILGFVIRSMVKAEDSTVYQLVDILVKVIPYVSVVFGLVEYIYVYADDFKARTMQVAIGTGVKRRKVILAKWLETAFLCLVDYAVLIAVIFGISSLYGLSFSGAPAKDIYILFAFGWIKALVFIGMTSIVVFKVQGTTGGMLLYIALSAGIIKGLFSVLLEIKAISKLHLADYLFSNVLDVAKSRAIIGTVSIPHILGIVVYAVISYIVACRLFKKRELEF